MVFPKQNFENEDTEECVIYVTKVVMVLGTPKYSLNDPKQATRHWMTRSGVTQFMRPKLLQRPLPRPYLYEFIYTVYNITLKYIIVCECGFL